ncbi:hypothetical protein VM1G_12005 [Cytospora mali]|uniref:Uncharacterized protein n=1 Tax=Cytospora mali TaxID=578113 RepID=A0A194VH44_CYTMA|nr:hypothetical protein VM1G_12005 [Valsa mali]
MTPVQAKISRPEEVFKQRIIDLYENPIPGMLVLMTRMCYAPHLFRGYTNEHGVVDVWRCVDQPEIPIGPITPDSQSYWNFTFDLRHQPNHPFPYAKVDLYIEEACMHQIIVRIDSNHFVVTRSRRRVQEEELSMLEPPPILKSTQQDH